jgi:hypothetical protein
MAAVMRVTALNGVSEQRVCSGESSSMQRMKQQSLYFAKEVKTREQEQVKTTKPPHIAAAASLPLLITTGKRM